LGRMLAIEAKKMGYAVAVLDPENDSPASQVADISLVAHYGDEKAVAELAAQSDVLTFEFENVDADPLINSVAGQCPIHPHPSVLRVAQNREREKTFLRHNGFPCVDFAVVSSGQELVEALERVGTPAVLKTADSGYDGKGQVRLDSKSDPEKIWSDFGAARGVLEAWVEYRMELSVICARWADGRSVCFPAAENIHRNHILDQSVVPARLQEDIAREVEALAASVAERLQVVGLLTVELFLLPDGRVLINELAPRPHNSGHFSFDACVCSQFEQHLRAVCNLPPGSTQLLRPVVMVNLLGDLWTPDGPPDFYGLLEDPDLKLHLYGKKVARPGRKMGHLCVLAQSEEVAMEKARVARRKLGLPSI